MDDRIDASPQGDDSTTYQQRRNGRGRSVPYLRMRGEWLQQLGFARGQKVRIVAEPGRLVLTLDAEEPMPQMIEAEAIERVKRSADLAAIVRAHGVVLKKSGKQLVGKCPFHSPDKTPSFFVDPALGKWKCFGACAAKGDETSGGDVFRFLMQIDNLTFVEAVEKAGGTIEREASCPTPRPREDEQQRQR